ncbi:hypothetical protein Pcinc_001519 [Petrolisthes cinctipes]|uniref:Uncharacterized protein n=1 Tax=Petrolisthes cinctipes TaxID=88211 RepID=A0AAE1GMT9_PETCI|nr:hypothetical protein Pcinc_001519 [Petrolisthes cinctipes]
MVEKKPDVKNNKSKECNNQDKGKKSDDRLWLIRVMEEARKVEEELRAWKTLELRIREWKRSHRPTKLKRKYCRNGKLYCLTRLYVDAYFALVKPS